MKKIKLSVPAAQAIEDCNRRKKLQQLTRKGK